MTDAKTENWLEESLTKRHRPSDDPHRPSYHFTAPWGWLNDPNGLIQWRGQYHMFYQHNPLAAKWGPPYWGHAVSDDLVRWRDQPIALTPEMPPEDEGGCWSGCAVDDNGVPTFVYTGVKDGPQGEQVTCLARGDETLTSWAKHTGNPVVRRPGGLALTQNAYRDPYVWLEGDTWYQVVGTSVGERGQALLYRSSNLISWEYLHPLIPQEVRETLEDEGHTWECPNFFALGDKYILIVSLSGECLQYPVAFVGAYRDHAFFPETMQRVDWGYHCFYAPLTMKDAADRRLIWGWLQEQRSEESQLAAGWSGVMSLPRVLSLEGDNLVSAPTPELESLRDKRYRWEALELSGGLHKLDVTGKSLELTLTLRFEGANEAGIVLALAEDEREGLYVVYKREQGALCLEPRSPHREEGIWSKPYEYPLELKKNRLELRIFLDGSAVEVFAQGVGLTGRVYPRAESRHTSLYADGAATLEVLEVWTMKPIWSNSERP